MPCARHDPIAPGPGAGVPTRMPARSRSIGQALDPDGKAVPKGGLARVLPEAGRPAETAARPRNPYDDLFGQMFETGARQRDEYQKTMENIFDQFTRGMDRHR